MTATNTYGTSASSIEAMAMPYAPVTGTPTATAAYNGDGLRAWKQAGGSTTYYVYDGDTPVIELNSSGVVTAVNTFGPNGLVSRNAGGSSIFYTFDEQGNVSQRLDSSVSVLSSDIYDAFGAMLSTGTPTDPYGFGAQWGYLTDRDSGFLLLTYRYYDPSAGRFLTRDPIRYSGGINLYAYAGNNPINSIDPSGLTVSAIFDRSAGTFTIWNDSNPSDRIVVTDAAFNQSVFSGEGPYMNQPSAQGIKSIGPIPGGNFLISTLGVWGSSTMGEHYQLLSKGNGWKYLHKRSLWARAIGQEYPGRQAFNLHAGRVSEGCVTIWSTVPKGAPGYPDSPTWEKIKALITRSGVSTGGYTYIGRHLVPGKVPGGEFIPGTYSGSLLVK